MESKIPSIQIFTPMCTCTRELAKEQYSMTASEELMAFLMKNGYSQEKSSLITNENCLTNEKYQQVINSSMICCRMRIMNPRYSVMAVLQTTSNSETERVFPTALPGPTFNNSSLQWY
jgi:hypothetical protein